MEETAEEMEAKERASVQAEVFDGKQPDYTPPGEQTTDDPLAGVNPALLETINKLSGEINSIKSFGDRLKQTESRIGSLSNKLAEEKKAAETKPTEEELAKKAEDDETWNAVELEFPDLAKGVAGKLNESKNVIEALRKEIEDIKGSKKFDLDSEIKFVSVVHPDWRDVVKTNEYNEWLAIQPPAYQEKAKTSQRAEDAVSVLNDFKDFKKTVSGGIPATVQQIRKQRLESSVATPGAKSKQFKQKSEAEMSEAELRESVRQEVFG
jgi:hypothetical protein